MGRIMAVMAACLLASGVAGGAGAQPVYKCTVGGKVSYADQPCAHGTATVLSVPPAPADAGKAAAKLERDKARLAELEKGRHARAVLEDRERERAARAAATQRQKCERLRLKARWLNEDLARAGREAAHAARLKAKRQAEALAVECPA
ncbi:DUF4124 domain-containing protein [Massilia niabensis]|uniref:DUF4124 domain-containing protein n=1 Tax=Massilia niabensis TaxID=544910 RepID=A0ABW0L6T4_9BURK